MKSKALPLITATVLVFLVASTSYAGTSEQPLSAAAKTCSEAAEGASGNAITACAQGYRGASAHATLAASCALGVGAIEAAENQHDCKFGFIVAGGVTQEAPSPSSTAVSECASLTEGASDGSPAACEQGYQDALAGDTQDASCDHLGAGAITAFEYVTACEAGWFVAKGEPACIPGVDPMNGQQGTTINTDAATDKTCSAAS
jgi:hypothetical protein